MWAMFTCSPPLMLFMVGEPNKAVDLRSAVLFFLPIVLVPAAGTILLWLPRLRLDTTRRALVAGISYGLIAPLLVGFFYMKIYPGFENQIAIFVGTLFTAPFSAAGGGVAGWLRFSPKGR